MQACKHASLCTLLALLGSGVAANAQTVPAPQPPVTVEIRNEAAVNTEGLDFSPTFYEDGIVFISTNTAGMKKKTDDRLKLPAMSILRSWRNSDGNLLPPQPFAAELTSLYHEGPVCFDRTAETIYFSRNALINGKVKLAKDATQKMRIYWSKKEGATWSAPQPLPFNNNEFDDCHPAISIDGDKLFFASNRPGGFGGMDLYVSYRVGDSWSEPINLGAEINTKGNEVFPFIHADNTLYFASDGLPGGKGKLDLYYVVQDGANWTKPINLGEPFNTPGDDFGLIVDLNKINGYFSTDGQQSKGGKGDDIYSFHVENGNLDDYLLQNQRVPNRNLDVTVTVTDKITGQPIEGAEVRLLNYDASTVIGRDERGNLISVQKVDGKEVIAALPPDKGINGFTNSGGRFATEVKPGNYVIIASKDLYQTRQVRLPISKAGNELTIALERSANSNKVRWNASVFNYVTNAPLAGAMLVLTNRTTQAKDTVITDANGQIDYYLDKNTKYKVDMHQGGKLIGSSEINTAGWSLPNQIMMQNFSVAPLLPGTVIELPNIYYNFNDATLRPDARKDLDLVVSLLKQQPTIKVEIASHTDCRGTAKYNEDLSQRRANGVVEYLVQHGISRERLRPVGYGESEPRNHCSDGVPCTEAEHARNRRTEIRILAGLEGAAMVYVDGKPTSTPDNTAPALPEKTTPKKNNVNVAPASGGPKRSDVQADHFYVIAGSFQEEARAQVQLQNIQAAGYANAQIVQFPASPFHSVCVDKFTNRKDAEALERKLKRESIPAFIRHVPKVQ
ncbi:MAG: OmpA family protein [Saprospiraceae bacterium]|nr:OmpA family protein [Saprospiraceae bacterium]MDW8230687.1 OmpA family protein [Saprospiraceae bacterium]